VPVLIGAACFEGQPTQGGAYILDVRLMMPPTALPQARLSPCR
jgi:hypothetical protein